MKFLVAYISLFISASGLQASLEDILAPLPELKKATVVVPEMKLAAVAPVNRVEEELEKVEPAMAPKEEIIPITKSDLHKAIELSLQEKFRPSGQLTLVSLRDLPNLLDYSQPFEVVMLSIPSRLSESNIQARFMVENEKGVIGEWTIPFRPHLFSEVYVVNAHLSRGELPTVRDFVKREVDMLRSPDAVLAYPETLFRHEYARDLRPGRPLEWGDLKERSLIKKGDLVEVVAARGLLAVTMKAISRQDGSEGDVVMLQNLDSHREFAARVIGVNRAEVSF